MVYCLDIFDNAIAISRVSMVGTIIVLF